MDIGSSGNPRDAMYWAKRAYRIDPESPQAQRAMGQALLGLGKYVEAIAYFERAYQCATERLAPGGSSILAAEAAHGLAACHGHRSKRGVAVDQEIHATRALDWLRMAVEHEPTVAEGVHVEAAFVHLRSQLQGLMQGPSESPDAGWLDP